MDIRLVNGSYKSITEFEWLNIPMFAVVTGPNGSGKTQMLELIARSVGLSFQSEGMEYQRAGIYQLPPFQANVELSPSLSSQDVVFLRSGWPAVTGSANLQSVLEQVNQAWNWKSQKNSYPRWDRLWSVIEEKVGKPCDEITEDEFRRALPPNFPLLSDRELLQNGIPILFISYLHRIDLLQRKGRTQEEIEAELAPLPWNVLDGILASANLPYRIATPMLPTPQPYQMMEITYTLALEDRATGQRIGPSDLSSGEKVMFMVALWFFSFSQRPEDRTLNDIQRLLLLDEPDAHLHPALTRTFLQVIFSELVEKHGVRIIMTTHSASTAALAPDSSLFMMCRQTPRIRQATSKWEALGQLTAGFLTIGSESKCVFVEDEVDREFYTTLQTLLMEPRAGLPALDTSRSILFVRASIGHVGKGQGTPSGGRKNVEKWVEMIPSTQIAGIIDRDDGNPKKPRIYVLGRHSLESYLLDPLFIFAVLLENKKAPSVPGVTLSVHDARRLLTQDRGSLQAVVDVMLAEMRSLLPTPSAAVDRLPVQYYNGPDLCLERWFMESSAKTLLEPLKIRFGLPWLNNHHELTMRYHVMEIVPSDLVEILRAIQAA